MMRGLSRDHYGVSNWVVLLVLVIVVAGALGVYYGYFVPGPGPVPLVAQPGDQLRVDYIGIFQDTGVVFDTSYASVARDNASYPKAFSFSWRESWQPLTFTIGDGSVVRGFDQGVRGMREGEAKSIVVPPELGYGPGDPAKIVVRPLLEPVPVRETMNESAFSSRYGVAAVPGSNVTDPVWGWTVQVSVANGIVTTTNSPLPGQVIRPYGAWTADVVSIDDTANNGTGEILVRHRLDPSLVDRVGGSQGGQTFYLFAVDLEAGTYTLNFNRQVVGRTLVFQVTVQDISRI